MKFLTPRADIPIRSIPGLTGCWDTNTGKTLVSGVISAVADDAATPHNLSQSTAGKRPGTSSLDSQGGRATALFDGVDDELTTGTTQGTLLDNAGKSIYIVCRTNTALSSHYLMSGTNQFFYVRQNVLNFQASNFDGTVDVATLTSQVVVGQFTLLTVIHDGTTLSIAKNGGPQTSIASGATTNNADTWFIGSANNVSFWSGDIPQVITCNVAHSQAIRVEVERMLKRKWNVPN